MTITAHLPIKVCGLRTPQTVDAALAAGADMIGLVFFPKSPRHVDLALASALAAQARRGAEVVALTVDATDDELAAIVATVAPDWLQLHGRESPERTAQIGARFGVRVMKAVGIGANEDIAHARLYVDIADKLLFDARPPRGAALPGGNGLKFDWQLIAGLDLGVPFMLSGGLDAANVAEAIRLVRPGGVDVSSGVESAPGVKDGGRIAAFVSAARAAFDLQRTPVPEPGPASKPEDGTA